jgi:hypothetical protein
VIACTVPLLPCVLSAPSPLLATGFKGASPLARAGVEGTLVSLTEPRTITAMLNVVSKSLVTTTGAPITTWRKQRQNGMICVPASISTQATMAVTHLQLQREKDKSSAQAIMAHNDSSGIATLDHKSMTVVH